MAMDYSTVFYNFLTSWSAPIVSVYLIMIYFSPRLMKLFRPFDLRRPLIVHNLICSVVSLYAVVHCIQGTWKVGSVYSKNKDHPQIHYGLLIYWISKLYELLDTVFMILRHRVRQISFLHVFHHSSVTLLADFGYFITPSPSIVPMLALNSAVHVIMYGYYALTAIYPLQEFSWKKRITQLQLVQFFVGITHALVGVLYYEFCVYSLLYGFGMIAMFSNFYYKAFILKKGRKGKEDLKKEGDGLNNSHEKLH